MRRLITTAMLIATGIAYSSTATARVLRHNRTVPAHGIDSDEQILWKLRSALNVAALQCQFDPSLKLIDNYKEFLTLHKAILEDTRRTLSDRMGPNAFDHYSTQLVNNFSAVDVQVPFCNKAAAVAAEADSFSDTELLVLAKGRVPEIQSIFPVKDVAGPVPTAPRASVRKHRHR